MSYVVAATESVAATLRPGQLIVLESTTYPGTTRELMHPAARGARARGRRGLLPLLLAPSAWIRATRSGTRRTRRRSSAASPPHCVDSARRSTASSSTRWCRSAVAEAAELVKLLENTFRMINIGLANEMAQVCDRLGVDVWEVIDAAATKPFGFMKFTPGPGLGGHCIPLDPHYLAWKMRTLNYKTRMIELAERDQRRDAGVRGGQGAGRAERRAARR